VVGFDVALDVGDLRVRSEAVFRWLQYDDGKHEPQFTISGPQRYLPSRLEYDMYLMASYRTPWRLEPYVSVETAAKSYVLPRYAGSSRATAADSVALAPSFGVNLEVATHLLVKAQMAWILIYDTDYTNNAINTPVVFVRVVNTF
jgi:hypothetical protein